MRLICRIIVWGFALLYALALFAWAAGTYGWFGYTPDPLSGVYLILRGYPWTALVDYFPEAAWPVLGALAPAINLAILYLLCRFFRRASKE